MSGLSFLLPIFRWLPKHSSITSWQNRSVKTYSTPSWSRNLVASTTEWVVICIPSNVCQDRNILLLCTTYIQAIKERVHHFTQLGSTCCFRWAECLEDSCYRCTRYLSCQVDTHGWVRGEFDVVKRKSWEQFQTIFHILVKELGNMLPQQVVAIIPHVPEIKYKCMLLFVVTESWSHFCSGTDHHLWKEGEGEVYFWH